MPGNESALIELAIRITKWPQQTADDEISFLAKSTGYSNELNLDATAIIVGFNFINRIADGLGVRYDVPSSLLKNSIVGRCVAPLVTMGIRSQMSFRPKEIPHLLPAENLARLARLFDEQHLGTLPRFFRDLSAAPHLLETQKLLLEASLPRLRQDETIGAPVTRAVCEMLEAVGANELRACTARWRSSLPSADGSPISSAILEFARKISESAYATEHHDIERLRSLGIPDASILDIVFAIAIWAGLGRLERLVKVVPREIPSRPESIAVLAKEVSAPNSASVENSEG